MRVPPAKITKLRTVIFSWWGSNRRDLPWRRTRDPYRILVSEVMLQQTQVSRVLVKYEEFLREFPDVQSLAKAAPAKVLTVWRGMGYNRRALYLKKTAETVVAKYKGVFPDTQAELTKLPGLGLYTARAIMVFAFEKNVAMVDTNIRHIITHFLFNGLPQSEKNIHEAADMLVPRGRAWEWHQALMDYGALGMAKEKKAMNLVKKQKPFKDSNRYYRGRIVDVLRLGSISEKKLITDFIDQYSKAQGYFEEIIAGLIRDGLVERKKEHLSLPG